MLPVSSRPKYELSLPLLSGKVKATTARMVLLHGRSLIFVFGLFKRGCTLVIDDGLWYFLLMEPAVLQFSLLHHVLAPSPIITIIYDTILTFFGVRLRLIVTLQVTVCQLYVSFHDEPILLFVIFHIKSFIRIIAIVMILLIIFVGPFPPMIIIIFVIVVAIVIITVTIYVCTVVAVASSILIVFPLIIRLSPLVVFPIRRLDWY